jgi:hypothetical protein
MLLRKGWNAILPCAGITLIRSSGIISDHRFPLGKRDEHPGNTENIKLSNKTKNSPF